MAIVIADVLNSMAGAKSNQQANLGKTDNLSNPLLNSLGSSANNPLQLAKNNDVNFEPTSQVASAYKALSMESAYQYSETMNLQLTTKEGDKVQVDFRQLYAEYQSYTEFKGAQQVPEGVTYFSSKELLEANTFESHLGFSVEGDLNDEELKAIFDVFAKVDELANSFFGGDIEKAFQKAIELEVDFSQIGSLSLNLTQTEMKAVQYQQLAMAEYSKAQKEAMNDEVSNSAGQISQLPEYLQEWQSAIERLDEMFADASEKMNEWVGDVVSQRFPEQDNPSNWQERVKEFHEKLQQAFRGDNNVNNANTNNENSLITGEEQVKEETAQK